MDEDTKGNGFMIELWQLYSEDGNPLVGQGGTKDDVYGRGLLHGAAHVWIWRIDQSGVIEILLQKRASDKRTWPDFYDISAAGHIDLGETPIEAAIRETKEEIGLSIKADDLSHPYIHRQQLTAENGAIENEFCWVYTLKLEGDRDFVLQAEEVDSLEWITMDTFKEEVFADNSKYVPHGNQYFSKLIDSVKV